MLLPFESDYLGCRVLLSVRNVLTVIVRASTISHVSFHCILHCIRSLLKSFTRHDCSAREVISLYLRKSEHCSGTIIFGVRSRWCVPVKKKKKYTHKTLLQWNRTCWTWRQLKNSSAIVGNLIHEMRGVNSKSFKTIFRLFDTSIANISMQIWCIFPRPNYKYWKTPL